MRTARDPGARTSKLERERARRAGRMRRVRSCPQSFVPPGRSAGCHRRLAWRTHDHLHRQASPTDDRPPTTGRSRSIAATATIRALVAAPRAVSRRAGVRALVATRAA